MTPVAPHTISVLNFSKNSPPRTEIGKQVQPLGAIWRRRADQVALRVVLRVVR